MNVGLIAHNEKKNLMEDFCVAYKKILEKHQLYATGTTARHIDEAANLKVHRFLPGALGGDKQLMEMICRNSLDMVLFFYNPVTGGKEPGIDEISKCCDRYNIPFASPRISDSAVAILVAIGIL